LQERQYFHPSTLFPQYLHRLLASHLGTLSEKGQSDKIRTESDSAAEQTSLTAGQILVETGHILAKQASLRSDSKTGFGPW
jgi:hypothetical protein